MTGEPIRIDSEVVDLARSLHRNATESTIRLETAREVARRAELIGEDTASEASVDADVGPALDPAAAAVARLRREPPRLQYPRWGWRRAIEFAVKRRMYTPEYLRLYTRYARHVLSRRAHGHHVEFQGMLFTGKRVELHARPGHGRLVLGPWCWIGNDNKLRAHEGQLTLGPKVVMGRDNVVNTYLDIELGEYSLYADWVYVCDFDHRFDRLDVPLKDQGIVKSPVRVGPDVWVGEKATILRGIDIGQGSVIASHCVVNRDIEPFSIVVGVPARIVGSRLPDGMSIDEGVALLRRGDAIPGDPIEG